MIVRGCGEPLLLLHELLFTWHSWGPCIERLASRYEVLAPTLPGHWGGISTDPVTDPGALADTVERWLDDEGFSSVHIAGNGFGAWLAVELARRQRARSLTMVAPLGLWRGESGRAEMARVELMRIQRAAPLLLRARPATREIVRRTAIRRLLGDAEPDSEHWDDVDFRRITAEAPWHCAALSELLNGPEFTRGTKLRQWSRIPASILLCDRDVLVSADTFELSGTHRDALEIHHLMDASHLPMMSKPDAVVEYISNTMARAGVPARDRTNAARTGWLG